MSACHWLVLASALSLLAGCDSGAPVGSAQAQANAQTAAACRQRADALYNIRHRDTIYSPASQVNTPFSANYQPGVPDRGLSQLFERDTMVSDCERNIGAQGDRTPDQGASAAPTGSATPAALPLSSGAPPGPRAPPPPDLGPVERP